MRKLFVAVVCVFVAGSMCLHAQAAGYTAVGKEQPDCSPLVARGVYPDALNKVQEAVVFPGIGLAIERVAQEIKVMLGQFGTRVAMEPTPEVSPAPTAKDVKQGLDEDRKPPAKAKKPTKKRKIKMPPRAL